MHKILLTSLLVTITCCTMAQADPEKYAATITASDLKKHLSIIAGPEMEGRETASPGQKKAAAYIEQHFQSLGLLPGNKGAFQQVYPLVKDSMTACNLTIGKKKYAFGSDFMVAARFNSNRKVKASKLVFAGYGISDSLYNDYSNLDVKDAIVVLAAGEPKQQNTYLLSKTTRPSAWFSVGKKIKAAFDKGASGVLVVSSAIKNIDANTASGQSKTTVFFPSMQMQETYAVNFASISQGVFNDVFGEEYSGSILKKLDSSEVFTPADYKSVRKKVAFDYDESSTEMSNSSNVMAVLEGTDKKDEYVFLTAHYDHLGKRGEVIYYGADDDGSGTVSVLEMAEAFAKAKAEGNGPRRTIVFMTVSGEEKGLWGSEYYSDHPVFPLEKTSVDLNTDMVGRIDPKRTNGDSMNYVYVIGDDKLSSDLKTISEAVNNKYTHLELDYKYNDPNDPGRIYYRSDHFNFARKGVPILFYFNGTHADYHRPTDTVDKINFDLMEKRVHLVFLTAWEMANRDEMLKRDIPLK